MTQYRGLGTKLHLSAVTENPAGVAWVLRVNTGSLQEATSQIVLRCGDGSDVPSPQVGNRPHTGLKLETVLQFFHLAQC